ncbi:hypothetical protein [Viscerimonas tarda]
MKLRNFFCAAILMVSAISFNSCSEIFPPQIDSPEALDKVISDLTEISKNYNIISARLVEKEKLSGDFGLLILELSDAEGKHYEQKVFYNYSSVKNEPAKEKENRLSSFRKNKEKTAINVVGINKENIAKYVAEAKTLIPEEYKFDCVGGIFFTADDDANLLLKLTLDITDKNTATRIQGRNIVTDYYELEFDVDKDGKVTLNE